MKIRVLSRKSDLAIIQAREFSEYLQSKHPFVEIDFLTRSTSGDKDLQTPLSEMPTEGVFTNDLRDELINNKCDLIVHSWKDLPIEVGDKTKIAATLKRADKRDILFLKKNKTMDSNKITILCSSPRRQYNLENFIKNYLPQKFDKVNFENIRGNIPTRFKKFLENPDSDGFIVAKAAIDRLLLNNYSEFNELKTTLKKYINECLWSVLPLSINPCSPGQGALAIETRIKDNELNKILNDINVSKDYSNVIEERNILKNYGGGCHQKIGVSYISHKLGLVVSKRGEDESGNHFQSWELVNSKDFNFSCNNINEIYPEDLKSYKIFSRKQLNENISDVSNLENKCIYITRISSIQNDIKLRSNNIIWASGLRTWKNLAERGMWVNGTSDGLGEDFENNINSLTNFSWIKLTHSDSPDSSIKNKIETYRLEPIRFEIDIQKKKYFYWMSSSAFKATIEKYPEIIKKYHFCGPGNTYNEILKILGEDKNLFVELSYDSWKNKLLNL
ncbi:hydroxymethylbilane synthase [Pelagibacteraceae bacterium]|nr:hydroxymethylbilane synthase [Pelagibacteraceae bacterium]